MGDPENLPGCQYENCRVGEEIRRGNFREHSAELFGYPGWHFLWADIASDFAATSLDEKHSMDFLKYFDGGILKRAYCHVTKGQVGELSGSPNTSLLSKVRNRIGDYCQQNIKSTLPGSVDRGCSYALGKNCKHVTVALIVRGERNPSNMSHQIQTRIAQAGKLTTDEPQRYTKVGGVCPDDYPPKIKERLLYILECDRGALSVSLWKGRRNAAGTGLNVTVMRYDVRQILRSSIPQLTRPIDPTFDSELARAKLINGPFSCQSYSDIPEVLRKPSGAGADLIARACKTVRCFADINTRYKLTWSQENRPAELTLNVRASGKQRPEFAAGEVLRIESDTIWIGAGAGKASCFAAEFSQEVTDLVNQSLFLKPDDMLMDFAPLPK